MTRKTLELFARELEVERLGNVRRLAMIRLYAVVSFFALHLLLGWGLGLATFRGKELIFFSYTSIAGLLVLASNRSRTIRNASTFAIPLIDLPFTFLILETWAQGKGLQGQMATGLLGLSFMIFFINLSGFYFSFMQSLLTAVMALILTVVLHSETQVPPDSRYIGLLLIVIAVFATHIKSSRLQVLVRRSFDEHLRLEKLSRYFSPAVAQYLQSNKDMNQSGQEMELTVLFADIRDFTKISESLSGPEVVKLLNEVHERLVQCIFETGGTLDKYIGDAVMAYFGAPVQDSLHADKAVECAARMRTAISVLNGKRRARGETELAIGIGVHSGTAVVGDVGAKFRREYTVIGDTVNTASRIESLTKKHGVDILVTESVQARLSRDHGLQFLSEDVPRGKKTAIRIYSVA
jgi:adenylate cyclase